MATIMMTFHLIICICCSINSAQTTFSLIGFNLPTSLKIYFDEYSNISVINRKMSHMGSFLDDYNTACNALNDVIHPVGIIEPKDTNCYVHQILTSLSQRSGLPLFRLSGVDLPINCDTFRTDYSLQLSMGPSHHLITKTINGFIDVAMRLGLIYQDPENLSKFLPLTENNLGKIQPRQWTAVSSENMRNLQEMQELRGFILDLSRKNSTAFFSLMSTMKLLNKLTIFVLNQDTLLLGLHNFANSDTNVTVFVLNIYGDNSYIKTEHKLQWHLIRLLMSHLEQNLRKVDLDTSLNAPKGDRCINEPFKFGRSLVSQMQETLRNSIGFFRPYKDSKFQCLNYKYDAVLVRQNSNERYASFDVLNGLKRINHSTIVLEGKSYSNMTFRVTTIEDPPFVIYREKDEFGKPVYGNDRWIGLAMDLLARLSQLIKFSYVIQKVADGNFGTFNETTGLWSGMIGELMYNKADLAMASLTITYDREKVIDFTTPYMSLGLSIIIKKAKPPTDLFQFLAPLSVNVWLLVILAYICVSFVLFMVGRLSPYEWYARHPCSQVVDNQFTLLNSFWFTVGSLMQQGCELSPRATSTRIIGTVWWFFILIMISSYTANLAAFLTIERLHADIEGVEDLARQTKVKFGTLYGGSTYSFFKNSEIDTYQRMWNFMKSDHTLFVNKTETGIERVLEGNYAFILESTLREYYSQRQCDLMPLGGLLDSRGYGIGLPPGFSRYRDIFSETILRIQKTQYMEVLRRRWLTKYNVTKPCFEQNSNTPKQRNRLSLTTMGGAFFGLVGGLLVSLVVCFLELMCWGCKMRFKYKKSCCGKLESQIRTALCQCSSKQDFFEDGEIETQVDKMSVKLSCRLNNGSISAPPSASL